MLILQCKVPHTDEMTIRHEFHTFADKSKTVAAAAVYLSRELIPPQRNYSIASS